MFASWKSLEDISELKYFDASNVTNMAIMLNGCALTDLSAIKNWDVSKVTNMYAMLGNNKFTEIDLSQWNISEVTNMSGMFNGCQSVSNINLSNWNTSKTTDMQGMFDGCSMLKTVYVSETFVTNQVSSSDMMFRNCMLIKGKEGTTYDENKTDATMAWIDGKDGKEGYFTAK